MGKVSGLAEFLRSMANMTAKLRPDVKYGASLEALILDRGLVFRTEEPEPREFSSTTMKECYTNALHGALEHPDLTYVEGYATGIIAVHHAWLVDDDGVVYDPTWGHRPDDAYIGIPFDLGWLTEFVMKKGTYGVFGWPDGWKFWVDDLPEEAFASVHGSPIPETAAV